MRTTVIQYNGPTMRGVRHARAAEIRALRARGAATVQQLAARFDLSRAAVRDILRRGGGR